VTVPTNSTITIHDQTVLIHPIIDEYYNASPTFKRSTTLAECAGQTTTEMAEASLNANGAVLTTANRLSVPETVS